MQIGLVFLVHPALRQVQVTVEWSDAIFYHGNVLNDTMHWMQLIYRRHARSCHWASSMYNRSWIKSERGIGVIGSEVCNSARERELIFIVNSIYTFDVNYSILNLCRSPIVTLFLSLPLQDQLSYHRISIALFNSKNFSIAHFHSICKRYKMYLRWTISALFVDEDLSKLKVRNNAGFKIDYFRKRTQLKFFSAGGTLPYLPCLTYFTDIETKELLANFYKRATEPLWQQKF